MNIYIVGGNGFARECYRYVQMMSLVDKNIHFAGFLGHNGYGHTVDYKELQKFYLGEVSEYNFSKDDHVVIGAGYPKLRSVIYKELKERNLKFFTIIVGTPLDNSVEIGEANVFIPPFHPSCNVKIGNCNVLNGDVLVGHDSIIGDLNFFGPRCQVLGTVEIGNGNLVGANSILLPHVKVGNNNKIAPLSVVYRGCKNNCYMLGNPALKVGNFEENSNE